MADCQAQLQGDEIKAVEAMLIEEHQVGQGGAHGDDTGPRIALLVCFGLLLD